MKEENIRFRDTRIIFDVRPPVDEKKMNVLAEWPRIEKKAGNFSLVAEPGKVFRHETVGVLGENAIGKTTFVRLLAGEITPDSGEAGGISVSYKPQYIDTDSDELVMAHLADALRNFNNEIINPLGLKPLLTRKMNELSGGQLQRVSIAGALSKNADLMLLDEPSAYLDVEQRLLVAKIIRAAAEQRGLSILVVDHDLVFLDYLSNRLLVFEGRPAESGTARGPFDMEEGMNRLLRDVGITLRRDKESGRPRINKPGSLKDREQKKSGKYYYV